jgi:hypothetical protein
MSLLLILALLGATGNWTAEVVEARTSRHTLPLEGLRGLTVDIFLGSITVVGDGGSDIRMVVNERVEAADRTWLERARAEATLEIARRPEGILVCADGPFRDPAECTEWAQGLRREREHYRVIYDIELRVPRSLDVTVATVEGHLSVSDVRGRLDVSGVQGPVEIVGATGPLKAGTVSGRLYVRFAGNPPADCSFSAIDGPIDVGFEKGLSADLSFETMSGEVLTDFDHEILPPVARRSESRSDGTTWRLEVDSAIRVGRGGPHHRFKSISGDILIRRN